MQMSGRAYFYIGGFNPRFGGVSPGSLVVREAIRCAIGDGAMSFDFLAGQEAYKYRWGAVDRPFFTRWISPAAETTCLTASSAIRHK
jgi:CelD/BcsL family acetyltransferase involved in cellulose biosynthesis